MAGFMNQIRGSESTPNPYNWGGLDTNPSSYYRLIGGYGDEANFLYNDILKSGAIRGSQSFSGDAYFAKGYPQGNYLANRPQFQLDRLLQHYSPAEVGNNNYFIEATERFNPNTNPLYKPNSAKVYRPLPSIAGVQAPPELAFPKGNSGSNWLTTVESTGKPVPTGTYSWAAPAENTSYWDRVNPNNQRGLKVAQAYTSEWQSNSKGFTKGNPDWKVLFDYTKDFKDTSIPQHLRNAQHIGNTILAQNETQAVLRGAGTTAKVGVGAAGLIGYGASIAQNGPVETVLSYGVPFTPMRMGIGPVLSLNSGEDDALDEMRTHRREKARAETINDEIDFFVRSHPSKLGVRNYDESY